MRITELSGSRERSYEEFLAKNEKTLFFHSNKYRKFLKSYLNQEDRYLLLVDENEEILGALPVFVCRNQKYGDVLNSLPFYGSNGGALEHNGDLNAKRMLLDAFCGLADELNCAASTIVISPFDGSGAFYESSFDHDFVDERTGQITHLDRNSVRNELMSGFHYKTRNMIRKAERCGIEIRQGHDEGAFDFLAGVHKENMLAINGRAKDSRFFKCVREVFEPGTEYRIYTAYLDNEPVASMLLFYFNRTVEYYTPVVRREFRGMQPISLLIVEAMEDAAGMGYKYWNWGGTHPEQESLYRFKTRWAAEDRPYYYFTRLYNKGLLELPKEELLKEYPYFYVMPFSKTEKVAV